MTSPATIVDYVKMTYPTNISESVDFLNTASRFATPQWTWRDFAEQLSTYVVFLEELSPESMSVTNSSTWAVCQEFLGNLSGDDLSYAQSRGGIWSMTTELPIIVISVRDILTDLRERYPSN